MKRILLFFLTLVLLASCTPAPQESAPLPEDPAERTVELFLRALEEFDTDAAEELLYFESPQEGDVFFLGLDSEGFTLYDDLSIYTENIPLYLRFAAGKMSHRITSSQEENGTVTVKAYVNRVDGSSLFPSAFAAFGDATLAAGLNGSPYPTLVPFIDTYLLNAVHNGSPAMTESVIVFTVRQDGSQWRIRFQNGLSSLFCASLFDDPAGIRKAMKKVGVDLS